MQIIGHKPRTTRRRNRNWTRRQFKRESGYQITIALIRVMLADGVITSSDFADMDDYLLTKYQPHLGLLRKEIPHAA